MPRIYTSNNDALDYCVDCFPPELLADEDSKFRDGIGPDGRGDCYGYDAAHPPYEDENYRCGICNIRLEAEDN